MDRTSALIPKKIHTKKIPFNHCNRNSLFSFVTDSNPNHRKDAVSNVDVSFDSSSSRCQKPHFFSVIVSFHPCWCDLSIDEFFFSLIAVQLQVILLNIAVFKKSKKE